MKQRHFYLKGSHVLSDCPSVKNNFEDEDDMEHLWHGTDRAKLKCWGGGLVPVLEIPRRMSRARNRAVAGVMTATERLNLEIKLI